jgi:NAD(P)-dependent dehydrogenase (short-subunit alcohol dehydrogenase family)
MDLGLDGDAALCTAASRGLGLACAEALAEEGADVAICGSTAAHVDDARERLQSAGDGDVLAVQTDLTDPDEVQALVETTVEAFGGLDHLVTSAGGPPSGSFLDTTDRDWYQAFDLLVMSVVWTVMEAQPHLADGDGGTITAVTSRTVRQATDALVLSNAVRRTVDGLVQTLATEFAPEIRVNSVLPGAIETGRIQDLIEAAVERGDVPDYEAGYKSWAADVPLDRIGEPRELGDVVAVLTSDRAGYVNGASLAIDGGSMRE